MISSIILFVDVVTILLISKSFKDKNKRVYILIFQMLICAIVYFGLNYMFRNAEKWNEEEINKNQTSQTDFSRTLEGWRLVG
jgi:ammonia channel protein AmtB